MKQGDSDLALAAVPLFTREDFTLLQPARLVEKNSPKQQFMREDFSIDRQYQSKV